MKNEKYMITYVHDKKPIKVTYDGDDFGIYEYNETTKRYEGIIGHINMIDTPKILNGTIDFIKIEPIE